MPYSTPSHHQYHDIDMMAHNCSTKVHIFLLCNQIQYNMTRAHNLL